MSLLNDEPEMIGKKKEIQDLEQDIAFIKSLIDINNVNFTHWNKIRLQCEEKLVKLKKATKLEEESDVKS